MTSKPRLNILKDVVSPEDITEVYYDPTRDPHYPISVIRRDEVITDSKGDISKAKRVADWAGLTHCEITPNVTCWTRQQTDTRPEPDSTRAQAEREARR